MHSHHSERFQCILLLSQQALRRAQFFSTMYCWTELMDLASDHSRYNYEMVFRRLSTIVLEVVPMEYIARS